MSGLNVIWVGLMTKKGKGVRWIFWISQHMAYYKSRDGDLLLRYVWQKRDTQQLKPTQIAWVQGSGTLQHLKRSSLHLLPALLRTTLIPLTHPSGVPLGLRKDLRLQRLPVQQQAAGDRSRHPHTVSQRQLKPLISALKKDQSRSIENRTVGPGVTLAGIKRRVLYGEAVNPKLWDCARNQQNRTD